MKKFPVAAPITPPSVARNRSIAERTMGVGLTVSTSTDLLPVLSPIYKLALFTLWSFPDRFANSYGVSPPRLVCGRFRL